jgi:NTP pyrophosphatase (non-canonical NTP hydrolase)
MNANEYQKLAMRTANSNPRAITTEARLLNAALGLTGEAGEIADTIKKYVFHGHELDGNSLVKEIGDILWYAAFLCETLGIDMSTAMRLNVEKLQKRYPNGFSAEDSINRVE